MHYLKQNHLTGGGDNSACEGVAGKTVQNKKLSQVNEDGMMLSILEIQGKVYNQVRLYDYRINRGKNYFVFK